MKSVQKRNLKVGFIIHCLDDGSVPILFDSIEYASMYAYMLVTYGLSLMMKLCVQFAWLRGKSLLNRSDRHGTPELQIDL